MGEDTINRRGWRSNRKKTKRSEVGICTKYIVFIENFFLVILGMAMTGVGSYILSLKEKTVHDFIEFILDPACDMCLAGCIIFVMGFLGCMGSLREYTLFLKAYYICLCLILLAELTIAILAFVAYLKPEFKNKIFPSSTFEKAIIVYRDDPDMKDIIDSMQKELECCGLSDSEEGYLDWNKNPYFNCSAENASRERCSVPYSCCIRYPESRINYQCGASMLDEDGSVTGTPANIFTIYSAGCLKSLADWINTHALVVGGIMLGIVIPQVVIVTLTRNLIHQINLQKIKWRK